MSLPVLNRIGYAVGNFGKSIQMGSVDYVYLFFLTDLVGIAPATAGVLLLVSTFWDAACGPVYGHQIDKFGTIVGSYSNLIFIAAPIAALTYIGIFYIPMSAEEYLVALTLIALLAFKTAYAAVDVPHNSLLGAISIDSRERSVLASYRFFFSAMGGVAVSLAAYPLLSNLARDVNGAYVKFALLLAFAYMIVMNISAASARKTTLNRCAPDDRVSLLTRLKQVLRNRPLLIILGIAALSAILIPVYVRLTVHFSKEWLGNAAYATPLILSHVFGQMAGLPIWTKIANRLEKTVASRIAHASLVVAAVALLIIQPDKLWIAICIYVLFGLSSGGIHTMNWALVPDVADRCTEKKRLSAQALVFGTFLFVLKVGAGVSMLLSGYILDWSGYDPAQLTEGPGGFVLLGSICLLPALGSIICLVLLPHLGVTHNSITPVIEDAPSANQARGKLR